MILLDTHVLLWHEFGDDRLGPRTRETFERALHERDLALSAISFWEIGMRIEKGQLDLSLDMDSWRRDVLEQGVNEIAVNGEIAIRAALIQDMHGDPADRLIVATAQRGHQLVTADPRILDWSGNLTTVRATD